MRKKRRGGEGKSRREGEKWSMILKISRYHTIPASFFAPTIKVFEPVNWKGYEINRINVVIKDSDVRREEGGEKMLFELYYLLCFVFGHFYAVDVKRDERTPTNYSHTSEDIERDRIR